MRTLTINHLYLVPLAIRPKTPRRGFFFPRFIAAAPRNQRRPQQRQTPQQTIVDHERTLGFHKKLPAGKSELAHALVCPSRPEGRGKPRERNLNRGLSVPGESRGSWGNAAQHYMRGGISFQPSKRRRSSRWTPQESLQQPTASAEVVSRSTLDNAVVESTISLRGRLGKHIASHSRSARQPSRTGERHCDFVDGVRHELSPLLVPEP
jgi:hypothetical protein